VADAATLLAPAPDSQPAVGRDFNAAAGLAFRVALPAGRAERALVVGSACRLRVGSASGVVMKRGDDVLGEIGAGLRAGWQPQLDDRKGVGLRRIGGKGPFEPRQFDAGQGVQGVCQAVQEAA